MAIQDEGSGWVLGEQNPNSEISTLEGEAKMPAVV